MKKIWQNVDTIKLHLYSNILVVPDDITSYNSIISTMRSQKSIAQEKSNSNESFKEYQIDLGGDLFQVMPATVRGFAVSVKNSDVTIHFKHITNNIDPNPFCKIEFRSSFLHRFGYLKAIQKVIHFIKSSIIFNFTIKISELHLQVDIQGYDFSMIDFFRIKTRQRNNRIYDQDSADSYYFQGRSFQGFMMGGGDYLMRVYNKTKEIKKFPNKSFIEELWKTNSDYVEGETVYRIEFQLRREKMKNMVIDGVVLDGFEVILNNINNIWAKCLDDFSLRSLPDSHCFECMLGYKTLKNGEKRVLKSATIRRRFYDSDVHPLWNVISTFNGHQFNSVVESYVKPFTSDFIYVHNAYKAFLSTALSHYGVLRPDLISDSLKRIEDYTLKKKEKTTLEDVLDKKLDRFNKVVVCDDTFVQMSKNKEYFLNMVSEIFENSFEVVSDKGLTNSFYKKLQKVI